MNDTRDTPRRVPGIEPRSDLEFILGRYPAELETDIIVRSGLTLHLRPIRRSDAHKLIAFHHRLSFDSIYRRYFSVHPELSHAEVVHLTDVDYVDRLALVFEDGDELVAVGRFDRYPSTPTAEVAFVVRDDYQHLGLGHLLLEALADAARQRGITTFSAETLPENHDMMSVFRHSGYPMTTSISRGDISVKLSLEQSDARGAGHEVHEVESG
jgi:GNAT superfamily N-acetyltransferase